MFRELLEKIKIYEEGERSSLPAHPPGPFFQEFAFDIEGETYQNLTEQEKASLQQYLRGLILPAVTYLLTDSRLAYSVEYIHDKYGFHRIDAGRLVLQVMDEAHRRIRADLVPHWQDRLNLVYSPAKEKKSEKKPTEGRFP